MGKTKDVRDAVEAELAFDPLVDATGITVKNLNGDVGAQRHRTQLPAVPGGGRRGAAHRRCQERVQPLRFP